MNECRFKDIVLKNDGFLRGPFGSALKKSLFVPKSEQTYKVYEQSVVLQNNPNLGKYYISKEYFEKNMSRFEVKKGDFLVSCSGVNYGTICYLNSNIEKGVINQALLRIRLDERKIYPLYFLYYFKSYIGKVITSGTGDSTIPNFPSMSIVKEIPIDLPTYSTQMYIGDLLNNISNKIAMNNKIISELESMAKTLYDYWFLQFDFPDENGKPYKSSGGKMVYNEELKREIPEGWEVKSLSQVILSSKNGDWGNEISKAVNDVQVRCFRGADFSSIISDYNLTAPIRFISESHRDRLLMDGDLVIEISGGSPTQATGRIGYINQSFLDRSDCAMTCSNFCKAFVPLSKNHQYWLYQTWKSYYDNGIMFNFESKTTGIKNLMFDDFCESIKVPVPYLELLQDYQNKVSAFYNLIQRSLNENSDLASLRDFLLPMLMNGQVTFK